MTDDSDDPTPQPKNLRRRLTIALVLLALALLLTHATWDRLVQRRLDTRLRLLHEAGEPIYPADFNTPALPAGQNAADDILAATDILKRPDAVPKSFDRLFPRLALPLIPDEITTISDTLAARSDVLTLAETAAAKPQVHWDIDPNTPVFFTLAPGLNGARGAATLLRADALLAHQQGRDDRALDRIEQLLRLSRHVDRQPVVVSHLVAAGLARLACQTAQDIAPDLRIGAAPGHVPPARLHAVIAQLFDDAPLRDGMTHALRGERKDAYLAVDQVLAGQMPITPIVAPPGSTPAAAPGPSLKTYALKPVFLNDADTLVRVYTAMIDGFKTAQDLPALSAAVDIDRDFPERRTRPALHMFSNILVPSTHALMTTQFRVRTDHHLAATALAIRAYAADHANQLPPTLDALVPTYLPAVATDPMAPNSPKLQYRPTAPDPILYSVGNDALDDGGDDHRAHHLPDDDTRPTDHWEAIDAVLHLTRQPRPTPPPDDDPQP